MVILDQVIEGTYGRVLSTSLSAGHLVLLDQVLEGTYGLVLYTSIEAGKILLSKTAKDGLWYEESGVVLDATYGIALYGGEGINAFRTFATEADYEAGTPVQVYIGTDGKLYAGGGSVKIDASGITIYGEEMLKIGNAEQYLRGYLQGVGDNFYIRSSGTGVDIILIPSGDSVRPGGFDKDLGSISDPWHGGYFSDRLKIPVGTDMYD